VRDVIERIARIEQYLDDVAVQSKNQMLRGTIESTDDSTGLQQHTVNGLYGEKFEKMQRWEQFGLSSMPPAGADCLIACMNGNRDSAQMIAAKSSGVRPQNSPAGSTTLYDNGGTTIQLDGSGNITITCSGNITFKTGGDMIAEVGGSITLTSGGLLTHNGKNVGSTHVHEDVVKGPDKTGVPAG
jgi:phage gp45-like